MEMLNLRRVCRPGDFEESGIDEGESGNNPRQGTLKCTERPSHCDQSARILSSPAMDGPLFVRCIALILISALRKKMRETKLIGIVPGIKVDKGVTLPAQYPGEKVTEGLDGLRERLVEYKQMGAKFAKWRAAVIDINERDVPTAFGIRANAHGLARYAALCQELDIVPIVEPEVLMDGAHDIERCEGVTSGYSRKCSRSLMPIVCCSRACY